VTDSLSQGRNAGTFTGSGEGDFANKAFVQSIALNRERYDLKLAAVDDPVKFAICGDSGSNGTMWATGTAYPDICALGCSAICGWADWDICTWAADCGLYCYAPNDGSFVANPELRKPYARHLSGVNVGYLDGHASWINSEALLMKIRDGDVQGIDNWAPTSDDASWVLSCFPDAQFLY
jgi:prepilin-type processing-associated H-X9-DG protein